MNCAQEYTINLLKKKIEYYKFMANGLRNIEEQQVYEDLLKAYKETLEKYVKSVLP